MHALSALNKEFVARGFHRKLTGRILAELVVQVTLMNGGMLLFAFSDVLLLRLFGLWATSVGFLAITTNTHTSAHSATSDKRWVNWALQILGYSYFIGMSATYWRHKHVVVHHPTPNVVGLDDDIDLLPWFLLNAEEVKRAGRFRRWLYPYQWLLFPLAINFNALNLQLAGWRYLIPILRDPAQRKTLHWIDLAVLVAHHLTYLVVPMLFFPPLAVLGLYLLRYVLAGWTIFIVFAPAHFPAEAIFLSQGNQDRATYLKNRDFVLLQCATTMNLRTSWFGNFFCGGTDYQIEHHLFPGLSHPHYRKMAPLVKQWCEAHGYPYRTIGFVEGFWKSWMAVRHAKPVHDDAELLRQPAASEERPVILQDHVQAARLLDRDPARALVDSTA